MDTVEEGYGLAMRGLRRWWRVSGGSKWGQQPQWIGCWVLWPAFDRVGPGGHSGQSLACLPNISRDASLPQPCLGILDGDLQLWAQQNDPVEPVSNVLRRYLMYRISDWF